MAPAASTFRNPYIGIQRWSSNLVSMHIQRRHLMSLHHVHLYAGSRGQPL